VATWLRGAGDSADDPKNEGVSGEGACHFWQKDFWLGIREVKTNSSGVEEWGEGLGRPLLSGQQRPTGDHFDILGCGDGPLLTADYLRRGVDNPSVFEARTELIPCAGRILFNETLARVGDQILMKPLIQSW